MSTDDTTPPAKRKPGRPKGSRNKEPRAVGQAREVERDVQERARNAAKREKDLREHVKSLRVVIEEVALKTLVQQEAKAMVQSTGDLQLIDASQLGKLVGRSTMMIKVDSSRRPLTLPPRFVVPGQKKLLWRIVDVREWMQALADLEADRRSAQVKMAMRLGVPPSGMHKFNISLRATGEEATRRMYETRERKAAEGQK